MSLTMDPVNFINTRSEGWEKKCEEWAQAKKPFEVRGIESQHFKFCHEFCAQYQYQYEFQIRDGQYVVTFIPAS
jgi:hypothetical protein